MIVTVSIALVSAVILAMSNAKKEKVEEELNFVKDSHMGLQEENRILNTCLKTMESHLEKGNSSDEVTRLEQTIKSVMSERDLNKKLWDNAWNEKNAYKKMYEEATKKAAQ